MSEHIHYGDLLNDAMRGMVRAVLKDVEKAGKLPGEHHFYITIETGADDVDIPAWLGEEFPNEMVIVIQHWYDNLQVEDAGFHITLSFRSKAENLYIPFDAIIGFADPHVEFSLQLEQVENIEEDENPDSEEKSTSDGIENVISLDSFRK